MTITTGSPVNRFVIADSTLCIGCRTCEVSCSENHRLQGLQMQARLKVMRNENNQPLNFVTNVKMRLVRRFVRLMPLTVSIMLFN